MQRDDREASPPRRDGALSGHPQAGAAASDPTLFVAMVFAEKTTWNTRQFKAAYGFNGMGILMSCLGNNRQK